MISGQSLSILQAGFGAVSAIVLVCLILFAAEMAKLRGRRRTIVSMLAAYCS